jgi:hypothetical protein
MAQIGHGYGSEWQLLRMLGHHREYFYKELRSQIGLSPDAEIHWLDYGWDNKKVSGDKEYKKREFFEKIPEIFTPEVMLKFKEDEFGSKLNQNWDGIFWVDKTVYIVEAKAHLKEINSDCQSDKPKSRSDIEQDFNVTRVWFGISSDNDWKEKFYQMANRIAFLKLLHSNEIDAKLVNIYFLNGYEKKIKDPDSDRYYTIQNKNTTKDEWEDAIKEEENYLGISKLVGKHIFPVFINCKGEE